MKGPSLIRDGVGGKEKDPWVHKKRFNGSNQERGSGKIVVVGNKSERKTCR